ncbi:Fur family transcriptional regulator [Albibacterium indicum]|uniref:Fur family transcriptional regulator n=1 Tax=Albibacterium indicum TaxID=2292082 RepID=UPI000E466F81|nr:transcriptional repressor [Pedobacter indicus]
MQSRSLGSKREKAERLLRKHNLKVTVPRLSVLSVISEKETATSQPDLEKVLGKSVDRVTLYRVLNVFEEKGILHKIFDLHGTATYALCSEECPEHIHSEDHVHFTCSKCNSVYCLNEVTIPTIETPIGFRVDAVGINAVGICAQCQSKVN